MEKTIRVTKSQRFEDIIAMLNGESVKYGTTVEDAVATLEHERELLAKKNTNTDKKKSAEQAKNDTYKLLIADFLASLDSSSDGMTCTEIGKSIAELSAFNTSKLSSLCNAMVKDGTAVKNTVKGKTLFKLA